jgi:hypothetical protein
MTLKMGDPEVGIRKIAYNKLRKSPWIGHFFDSEEDPPKGPLRSAICRGRAYPARRVTGS